MIIKYNSSILHGYSSLLLKYLLVLFILYIYFLLVLLYYLIHAYFIKQEFTNALIWNRRQT